MGKSIAALAATVGLASGVSAQNGEQNLVLKPSSPWVADFKDESCAIRRNFAGEGHELTLEFDNFGLGDNFRVALISGTLVPQSKTPKTRFEPDDMLSERIGARTGSYGGNLRGVSFPDSIIPRAERDAISERAQSDGYGVPWPASKRQTRAKEITGLTVTNAFKQDIFIATGSLEKAMNVMQQCLDDLLTSKGLDPSVQANLSRQPAPKHQMAWARGTQESYPVDLIREGKSGVVDLRVLIDEAGKVVDCATSPNGEDPRFGIAGCKSTFKYAQFDAARDAGGKPTKAYYSTRLVYALN